MGERLVPFIPDGYIEYDNLSDECIEGIAENVPSFVPPVGYVYTQYYGCSAPWEIFPEVVETSWQKLYSTDGLFFCTEGGDSPAFDGTVMDDQYQGHNIEVCAESSSAKIGGVGAIQANNDNRYSVGRSPDAPITGSYLIAKNHITDGTNGTPRTGLTTRPKSVTIRVWKRIL